MITDEIVEIMYCLVLRCFYKKWVSKKAELKKVFGKHLKQLIFTVLDDKKNENVKQQK